MEVCGTLHSPPLAAVQVANPSRQLEEFAEMRLETLDASETRLNVNSSQPTESSLSLDHC